MINFYFFYPNNFGFAHGMNVKFGLWTFHKLWKSRNILSLLTFGCPNYSHSVTRAPFLPDVPYLAHVETKMQTTFFRHLKQ